MVELLRSEIRKAESFASKRAGKPVVMTGWFTENCVSDFNTVWFLCEMFSKDTQERVEDVILVVWLDDRRRSYVI